MAGPFDSPEKQSLIGRFSSLFTKKKVPRDTDHDPEAPAYTTQMGRDLQAFASELFGVSRDRFDSYRVYEDMEADSPVICSALDATADTAVAGAEGDAESVFEISFEKENARADKIFKELDNRIMLRANSWKTIRSTLKLGDAFQEIIIDPRIASVSAVKPLPAKSMRVIPDEVRRRRNLEHGYEQWDPETGQRLAVLMPWQVVHFATKVEPEDIYGRSMLYSVRRTYTQLQMIEDSVVLNRLTRSTQRYKRTIPTPGMTAEKAHAFVERMKQRMTTTRRWDTTNNKLILENAPLSEETDFWVPDMGNGVKGDVEVLQGQSGQDRIEDVNYFQRKLFAGLRVPPSYMGWEQDSAGKAQIVTVDIAFARLVRRAQMTHGTGVRQILDTELALKGIDPESVEYDIVFAPIATTDEMRRWQIELLKAQVATMLKEKSLVVDDEYLLRNVLEIEEEFVNDLVKKAEEKAKEEEKKAMEIAKGQGLPAGPGGKVPGGQPAGEKAPPKNDPGREPPVRGGSPSRQEQVKSLTESLRRRGAVPHRHVAQAVRMVSGSKQFRDQIQEIYEMGQPLHVKRNPEDAKRAVEAAAGIVNG